MILRREPGARIASLATALPPHRVDRDAAAAVLQRLFPGEDPEFVRGLVERSGVEQRHIVPSFEEVLAPGGFGARNARYQEAALDLAEEACRGALDRARLDPQSVDVLIDVSCTGIAIPALDVGLAQRLGLRGDVRRIPVTESGCAAGGLALGMAATYAQSGQRALVVAVELCSLTLQLGDRSRTNLVAAVLFGDGAAAAVVTPGGPGPRVHAVGSHLIADSEETMGFDVGEHGLRIVLQRELPVLLESALPDALAGFLEQHDCAMDDIGLHLVHPGGRRILEAYGQRFGLHADELGYSRESLRRYGNLSSASILTVLELALADGARPPDGKQALVVAVGPGLSLELLLLSFDA